MPTAFTQRYKSALLHTRPQIEIHIGCVLIRDPTNRYQPTVRLPAAAGPILIQRFHTTVHDHSTKPIVVAIQLVDEQRCIRDTGNGYGSRPKVELRMAENAPSSSTRRAGSRHVAFGDLGRGISSQQWLRELAKGYKLPQSVAQSNGHRAGSFIPRQHELLV